MKWWIPLVVVFVCAFLLLIILVCVLRRRKRQQKAHKESDQELDIQPVQDEKMDDVLEQPVNLVNSAMAFSTTHQSKEDSIIAPTRQVSSTPQSNFVEVIACGEQCMASTALETDTLYNVLHRKHATQKVMKPDVRTQIARGLINIAQLRPVVPAMSHLSPHWILFDAQNQICFKIRNATDPSATEQDPQQDAAKTSQEDQRWAAPEAIKQNSASTTNADHGAVFSLGLILWEIETGLVPFGEVDASTAQRRLRTGERPKMDTVSEEMQEIIDACLAQKPSDRPSLKTVLSLLEQLDTPPPPSDGDQLKLASKVE
ncbi:putative Protein tyrosine kinase [Blattamonas nauphoetae]|uniref:Protein kinase domain-containing protein n=1 Tax=Blattamonas nauphoetae TaxID=2049346 RepID=A0ABQ9XGY2_9EUKA|nr:putative Protein tyrosine kinase [Blattamonas nauphoetae]